MLLPTPPVPSSSSSEMASLAPPASGKVSNLPIASPIAVTTHGSSTDNTDAPLSVPFLQTPATPFNPVSPLFRPLAVENLLTSRMAPTAPTSTTTGVSLTSEVVGQAYSPADRSGWIATAPVAPAKRATKMRPGTSNTARSLCSQDWCQRNPRGTTTEFKEYFDNLPPDILKTYKERSATKQLAEKQKPQSLGAATTGGDA